MPAQLYHLIEDALRNLPLRGFGDFDDFLVGDMVTALRSESKPTPSRETSLTTMASSDLADNFLRAFSRTFSVSAAKPIR